MRHFPCWQVSACGALAHAAQILISQYYQTHQQTQKQEGTFLAVISLTCAVSSEGASYPPGKKVCWSLYASERQAKAACIVLTPSKHIP